MIPLFFFKQIIVYMYVLACMHYARVCVCVRARAYALCMHTYIRTYVHTYTCMHAFVIYTDMHAHLPTHTLHACVYIYMWIN